MGRCSRSTRQAGRQDSYEYLENFDVRQRDSAIEYIEAHANDEKPFFMDVNFMKMHNPTNQREVEAG